MVSDSMNDTKDRLPADTTKYFYSSEHRHTPQARVPTYPGSPGPTLPALPLRTVPGSALLGFHQKGSAPWPVSLVGTQFWSWVWRLWQQITHPMKLVLLSFMVCTLHARKAARALGTWKGPELRLRGWRFDGEHLVRCSVRAHRYYDGGVTAFCVVYLCLVPSKFLWPTCMHFS
jgi:hypothetical protein